MGFIEKDNGNNPIVPVATMPNANSVSQGNVGASSTADGAGASASSGGASSSGGIQIPKAQEGFTQQPGSEAASTEGAGNIQLIDWSKPYSEIEQNDQLRKMKPIDIVKDYQKNGKGDWATFMPWLSQWADPNKSVQLNADDAQAAQRKEKMEKWGNFLLHLGNFFGTTQGAPAQKLESAQELTERQRKLREGTEALRQKGYDQILLNIYKERADRQAQLQAEAAAKANEALAAYRGAQKAKEEAITPELVKTEQAKQGASNAAAGLSTAKTKTEDELRGKKGALLTAQANNANAGADDHRAGVAVKGAQVKHINAQTVGQQQKNAAGKEADDFNSRYVNDPVFKKHVKDWAKNNHLSVGDNDEGRGGTWANEKNRQQATAYAKARMKHDRTPPSRRQGAGNKVPPSRRGNAGGGSKVPPSRR